MSSCQSVTFQCRDDPQSSHIRIDIRRFANLLNVSPFQAAFLKFLIVTVTGRATGDRHAAANSSWNVTGWPISSAKQPSRAPQKDQNLEIAKEVAHDVLLSCSFFGSMSSGRRRFGSALKRHLLDQSRSWPMSRPAWDSKTCLRYSDGRRRSNGLTRTIDSFTALPVHSTCQRYHRHRS